MTRFYIVIQIDPIGGVLGVYADASTEADNARLWQLVNEETLLCHDLFDTGALPEPDAGPGMLCICGEVKRGLYCSASAGPAPAWRRPTLDELIAVIEGRTPPNVRAWLDAPGAPTP